MQVSNNRTNLDRGRFLSRLFTSRYNASTRQTQDIESSEKVENDGFIDKISPNNSLQSPSIAMYTLSIEDTFTPSKELQAAMQAKSYVQNGLSNVNSFKTMVQLLQDNGILNKDERMAADFLASKSSIDFDSFRAMIEDKHLSREMRRLINQLVHKLQMVDYVSGGVM